MPVKRGFDGRGPVAIVTDGVNNRAKHFLSVSVITGGTNKNVSNNVKISLFEGFIPHPPAPNINGKLGTYLICRKSVVLITW